MLFTNKLTKMNLEQISQGLQSKFDQCRLVFWQGTDKEFTEQLSMLTIQDSEANPIEVILLDEFSHFQVRNVLSY